jgi:hypothetical protein
MVIWLASMINESSLSLILPEFRLISLLFPYILLLLAVDHYNLNYYKVRDHYKVTVPETPATVTNHYIL